jgi:hypothetical protein
VAMWRLLVTLTRIQVKARFREDSIELEVRNLRQQIHTALWRNCATKGGRDIGQYLE